MPHTQIFTEVPPISPLDVFVLFDRHKEHFDYPLHIHSEYELNYITGAAGAVRVVGDSLEIIGNEDLVLITGPQLEHAWMDGDRKELGGIHETTIQFANLLNHDNGSGLLQKKQFYPISKLVNAAQNGVAFSEPTIRKVAPMIAELAASKGEFESVLIFFRLLNTLAQDTDYRVLSQSQSGQHEEVYDSRRIKAVKEFMSANFQRKITLKEAADLLNMSEPSFTRFIKKRTGMSFVDNLNNVRIGVASRMLVDEPATTIAEIAYRCGFNNLSNFNRIFKKKKNYTPHEFREYYRKNKIII